MTAPLKIKKYDTPNLRIVREEVADDNLRILWRRKGLITGLLISALLLTLVALIVVGPRYTAAAIIEFHFSRDQPAANATSQPIATVDAVALVESAAGILRSRATASAVVTRLELDKDPEYSRQSTLRSLISAARRMLGLEWATPAPSSHDLAVNALMRQIAVTNEARSYLISIAATAEDPDQAARLANTVALEYLRSQLQQQLMDARAAAERDLAELALVYGSRHPSYVRGRAKLEDVNTRLASLGNGVSAGDLTKLGMRQSLLEADKVLIPSSPDIRLILGLLVGAALAGGVWLALRLR